MFDKENEALKELEERMNKLSRQREKETSPTVRDRYSGSKWDLGTRIVADLVAGVVVGLGIGVLFGKWFEAETVFIIVFLFLGGMASFLNVYKTVVAYEKMQERRNKDNRVK